MGLTAEAAENIADEVMAILGDAEFAALFGPDSRAEAPIVGKVYRGNRIGYCFRAGRQIGDSAG